MKDTDRQNARNGQKKRTGRDASGPHSDTPVESYTPAQRRTVRKGLRILAKVAVRAHMRRNADLSETDGDRGEGRIDSEERPSGV